MPPERAERALRMGTRTASQGDVSSQLASVLLGQFLSHKSQELCSSCKVWSAAHDLEGSMLKQGVLLNRICIKSSNLEANRQPLEVLNQRKP